MASPRIGRKAERRMKRGGSVTLVPLDFESAEGELARHEPSVASRCRGHLLPRMGALAARASRQPNFAIRRAMR